MCLGTFDEEEDAARAYDEYIFESKGSEAPQNLKGLEYIVPPAFDVADGSSVPPLL